MGCAAASGLLPLDGAASLEDAVARSDQNAKLWEALGHAYMSRQGSMFAEKPDMPSLIAMGERARASVAHRFSMAEQSRQLAAALGRLVPASSPAAAV